jgi:hypothetical protein
MNLSSFRRISKLPFFHSTWRIQAEAVLPPRAGFFSESLSLLDYVKKNLDRVARISRVLESHLPTFRAVKSVFLNLRLQVVFQDAVQAELAIGNGNAL